MAPSVARTRLLSSTRSRVTTEGPPVTRLVTVSGVGWPANTESGETTGEPTAGPAKESVVTVASIRPRHVTVATEGCNLFMVLLLVRNALFMIPGRKRARPQIHVTKYRRRLMLEVTFSLPFRCEWERTPSRDYGHGTAAVASAPAFVTVSSKHVPPGDFRTTPCPFAST